MTVVTRFAPSPTGFLHIGGARTAFFSWLYAKKMQGQFILRIEDTDLERSTQESVEAILDAMAWLNLDYDQGPYYQTKRFDRYREVIDQLLKEGKAYRCTCSKERLEQLRAEQTANKEKPRYDGHCRDKKIEQGDHQVIRFRNPLEGAVEFDDLIRGKLIFQNSELDDLIILRSDGAPTYNFTVVVDDNDMKVTHVIRGDDHINNTPRQINMLRALGARLPIYSHVSMILGSDGKRLSKRHGAEGVMEYREAGFLAEALLNYLVRLGWSHGDKEIFSREELIQLFDMDHISKAPAAFNPEKLMWLNQHYIKTLPRAEVAKELAWQMKQLKINITQGPSLEKLIDAQAERAKTLKEMALASRYFYEECVYDANILQKHITADILPALTMLQELLAAISDWTASAIHDALTQTAEKCSLTLGKIAQPLRVAVTGGIVSPPIDVTLVLLGREKTLDRLKRAIKGQG